MSLMLLSAGCEPTSITEARDQLRRGPARTVEFTIPVTQDTVTVGDLLCPSSSTTPCDTVTTPQGLMGIEIDSQTVAVGVGNQLRFDNLTLTRLKLDVPAGVPAGPYTVPPVSYAALDSEPQVKAVDTVVARSGTLTFTTSNRLPGTLSYTLTLNGFLDALGNPLARSGTVPAAPGTGAYTSGTVTFDLANVRIVTANVSADLSGTVNLNTPTTAATQDSSIIQAGTGTIGVQRLSGSLDPAATPELIVTVSDSTQIDSTQFDFGDLKNAIDSVTLNDAQLRLTLSNASGAPIVLSSFVLRTDSQGTAITLPVTDPGATTVSLARGQSKVVTLQAARLINSVVHEALDGASPAIVATGTATVGDGVQSTIADTDEVSAGIGLTVGLDFGLPAGGVTYSQVSAADGADFDTTDANQLAQRVDLAAATAMVQNGTPFGVQVRIAMVLPTGPGAAADTVPTAVTADSIFRTTGRVEIGPVALAAAAVDPATGLVTAPVLDTVTVSITGTQSRVLLGPKFWTAVRVTLLPSGTSTRGAVRPTDRVVIRAQGSVRVRTGGAP